MTNRIYYLSTCDTCRRILSQINDIERFQLIDIKSNHLSIEELEQLSQLSRLTYEELFNKRARKYKDLNKSALSENRFKELISTEYTFLKRPVIIYNSQVFVGNAKKTIETMLSIVNQ